MLSACTNTENSQPQIVTSDNDLISAYLDIVDDIKQNSNTIDEDLTKTLKKYDKQNEEISINYEKFLLDYFTDDDSSLKLLYSDEKSKIIPIYEIENNELKSLNLYIKKGIDFIPNKVYDQDKFMNLLSTNNHDLFTSTIEIYNINKSNSLKSILKAIEDVNTNKNVNLKDVENLLNIKFEYIDYENIFDADKKMHEILKYTYKNENEEITIHMLDDSILYSISYENKNGDSVFYTKASELDSTVSPTMGVLSFNENIDEQTLILNKLDESI